MSDAAFLDVILYSAEQLSKEYLAMPSEGGEERAQPPAPWGIISIKAQVNLAGLTSALVPGSVGPMWVITRA